VAYSNYSKYDGRGSRHGQIDRRPHTRFQSLFSSTVVDGERFSDLHVWSTSCSLRRLLRLVGALLPITPFPGVVGSRAGESQSRALNPANEAELRLIMEDLSAIMSLEFGIS